MGTKVSKQQGPTATKKVKVATAFNLVAKQAHAKRLNVQTFSTGGAKPLKKLDLSLPPQSKPPPFIANHACLEGSASCGFPIASYIETNFNVNAGYGGGTALALLSRRKSDTEAANLFMVRCGVDGNIFEVKSVAKLGTHNIYDNDEVHTDGNGNLLLLPRFGFSHGMVLSNIATQGHCGCGVYLVIPKSKNVSLGISARGGQSSMSLLVICSNPSQKNPTSQIYLVQLRQNGQEPDCTVISGQGNTWQFKANSEDTLCVQGPSGSVVTMFSNHSEVLKSASNVQGFGKVLHTEASDGTRPTILLQDINKYMGYTLLVLCSYSFGRTDTTSGLYHITLARNGTTCHFVSGMSSSLSSPQVWTVATEGGNLVIYGPTGPNRYAFLSNILEDVGSLDERCFQTSCLATGDELAVTGSLVPVGDDLKDLRGWINKPCKIKVMLSERTVCVLEIEDLLEQPDGRVGFKVELSDEDRLPGWKLFRAFAVFPDQDDAEILVELGGSPQEKIIQPPGVHYAVNFGGPTYQALNGIVFQDTVKLFKSHPEKGLQRLTKFGHYVSPNTNLHAKVSNTYDTYIYGTHSSNHPGFVETSDFDIPVKNGTYSVKLYSLSQTLRYAYVHMNGMPYTEQIVAQVEAIKEVVPGFTAKVVTIPVTVTNGNIHISFGTAGNSPGTRPSGLVVHDDTYKEIFPSAEQLEEEQKEKSLLADKLVPLDRTFAHKEIKIAGWSSNLLENSTGQNGDLSHWDYAGDWVVRDGGDGVETKFVSSYMQCVKHQEIDLTKLFSEKHLDSAPEIQVSESFHQGCNNGGYYSLTATLMDYNGATIASKSTGVQGSMTTSDWVRELHTFTDYGPGVRLVAIETTGKDDKFWQGHFGPYASAACIRVKSEVVAATGDEYADVHWGSPEECSHQIDGLVKGLQSKYSDELQELKQTHDKNDSEKEIRVNFAGGEEPSRTVPVDKSKKKKREIRVFVSSTFRDFVEEREILIKKAFRELNRLCLDRGVFFTYVDLRWGITEKQTKNGQTISICLREIDKCRPYFICLLGDRFGWNQRKKKLDKTLDKSYNYAIENYKDFDWLEDFRFDTSVTKLEILHGALRSGDKSQGNTDRIFFYLREPRLTRDELPPPPPEAENDDEDEEDAKEDEGRTSHGGGGDEASGSKEDAKEEVESGKDEKSSKEEKPKSSGENQWHFDQQQSLREKVKSSGLPVREFKTAEDGCALIKEDLERCVNEDFPPGTEMSALEREREAHLAFAEVRRRIYIGREEYFKSIDDYFVGTPDVPLVVLGESGSGKSALVANWCGRYQEKHPEDFMFMHFIGSSAESANYLNILRRLYEEMKAHFQLCVDIPSSDRNLVLDLPSWLSMAGRLSRCVIVLDALNQLDSGSGSADDEQELKWLPKEFPPNVVFLLSTLPGKALEAVEAAEWPTFRVEPLNANEKEEIIDGYMHLYGKTLTSEQKALIIEANQSCNPLYLKALLDEVRMYGSFTQLTTAIKSYLAASNAGDLFVKILERFEVDFEQGSPSRPYLVRDATTAIWCSHRGMSEQELLNFLKVPSGVWSPFYLSLEENLVNRNGIVNFFHDHLRQAVERKYLPTAAAKQEAFLKLANFFNSQDIDDRYADEVPFLLAQAKEYHRLRGTILNIAVFERLMKTEDGKFQLIKSWRLLGGFEQVEEAYLNVLHKSEQWEQAMDKATLVRCMAGFFMQLGLLNGARLLFMRLLKELELRYTDSHAVIVQHHAKYERKRCCYYPDVIDVLIELGTVSRKLGNLDLALKYLEDALSRLTHVRTPLQKLQLVKALIGTSFVIRLQGAALDNSKAFLIRASEVANEVLGPSHHYVAAIVGQIGELSYDQGRLQEALLMHLWDLQLTQGDVGLNHPRVAAILNNIALVHDDMNDKKAGELFTAALVILRDAYGKDHVDVASVRFNLGAFYFATNMYQKANYQFTEALRVFEMFLGPEHEHTIASKEALKKLKAYIS